ncbi:MAG TPA: hypothetical protein VFR41_07860 [Acidimicrobiia bacterium]|nr:hypothetical protein [Acidimicrobiia bacterium]
MTEQAWDAVLHYLQLVGRSEIAGATDLLERVIDAEGIGGLNDALADVCRSLMDRIVFPPGTLDIHAVVDRIALRVTELSRNDTPGALDRQRSLIVYLGSEGLPCAARADVASWTPEERLHDLIACMVGLVGIVAGIEHTTVSEAAARISRPDAFETAEGMYALAWRGPSGSEPFAGVVPRGYTAHVTFLGANEHSLRAVFARVALLRDLPDLDLEEDPSPAS